MANISILVSSQTILECAEKVIQEDHIPVHIVKVIDNDNAAKEARLAIEAGTQIIIARGIQATRIKEETNIPVVELRITAQEMGRVLLRAKQLIKKESPVIGIVGMFICLEYLDSLFDLELKYYPFTNLNETETKIKEAIADGVDVVLGGVNANQIALELGVPSLFIDNTEPSIRNALDTALHISSILDLERLNHAQLETFLDTSFNGIIKININREVVAVNRMMEQVLEKKSQDLIGMDIGKLLMDLDEESIEMLVEGRMNTYSTSSRVGNALLMVTAATIQYDKIVSGVIFTCSRIRSLGSREKIRHSFSENRATGTFQDIIRNSKAMKKTLELAKSYALSTAPLLIIGGMGTEKNIIAEGIHNYSQWKEEPFLHINCSMLTEEEQKKSIFGFNKEEEGTIFLQEIESLTKECQCILYHAIQYKTCPKEGMLRKVSSRIRVIASTECELSDLVKEGAFRKDLFYLLNTLKIKIPSLAKDEIQPLSQYFIEKNMEKYSKYVEVQPSAYEVMKKYTWPGNIEQLEWFCEKLVLNLHRRIVDEGYLKNLIFDTYPELVEHRIQDQQELLLHPEAVQILELLEKHKGNRGMIAEELNISTTTLWRKMKKYSIGKMYEL